jgi:hypothetical protein
MLAPLTSLVDKCGHTKVTKAEKTKKTPLHWDEVHHKVFDVVETTIAIHVALVSPDSPRDWKSILIIDSNRWEWEQ